MGMTGFDELADLALRKSGQAIRRSQRNLIEARLGNILRRENFSTLAELSECLQARPNPAFEDEVVAAMASKQSHFFHDRETLGNIIDVLLPKAAEAQEAAGEQRPLRVLCAGGGTGQEVYSLAILLAESDETKLLERTVELVSVDLCKASTERAEAGVFGHFEIQMGLSVHRMLKYFTRKDDGWKISGDIRRRVSFEVENLMQPFDGIEGFDIILCRNVLHGMTASIGADLARRLGALLGPAGLLFLGENESLPDMAGLHPSLDIPRAYYFDPSRDVEGSHIEGNAVAF